MLALKSNTAVHSIRVTSYGIPCCQSKIIWNDINGILSRKINGVLIEVQKKVNFVEKNVSNTFIKSCN